MRVRLKKLYEEGDCVLHLFYATARRNYGSEGFRIENVIHDRTIVADHCIILNWYGQNPADVLRACMYRYVPIKFYAYVYRYIRVNGTEDYSLRIIPETIEIKIEDTYVPIKRYSY